MGNVLALDHADTPKKNFVWQSHMLLPVLTPSLPAFVQLGKIELERNNERIT